MSPARQNRLITLALWLLFYCSFTLFSPPLLDDADSVHAEVAREMLLRHDFVTLYANNIRYLEKAPLYYWSMAGSMKVFGATTAASRLPLAFSVLALALLLEAWARRTFASARAGLYAALITLSSFGIFIFSRLNLPDVLVCVLLTTSLYAFARAEAESIPSRRWCWLFASALALDLLTKGLIGLVFPVAIVGLFLLATRGFRGALRRLLQCHPLSSSAILLAIAVPWHVLIALSNPGHGHPGSLTHAGGHWQLPYPTDGNVHGWAWFYFLNEQLYRYLNLRIPHDYDTSPLWLFLGLIFIWLMPWSAFLPTAIARALRSLRPDPSPQIPVILSEVRHQPDATEGPATPPADRSRPRLSADTPPSHDTSSTAPEAGHSGVARISVFAFLQHLQHLGSAAKTNLFLLLWLAVPLLFFSLSTRQEYYVLPSLPPMILLIAALLAESSHPVLSQFTRAQSPASPPCSSSFRPSPSPLS